MVPTLLGVAVLIFVLLRVVPGRRGRGCATSTQGSQFQSQELMDLERAKLGLDQPLWKQFAAWMAGLARLDFGISMWTDAPITEEIKLRFALSLQLAIDGDRLIAMLLAIPLGILAALKQDTLDRLRGARVLDRRPRHAVVLARHPDDPGDAHRCSIGCRRWSSRRSGSIPWQNLAQLIWPALAVGYRYSAVATRMMRSAMLEVLREDYIRTARAKGLWLEADPHRATR